MTPIDCIPLPGGCTVTLHRTLRIPDDGDDYPLPPSLGSMTVHRVNDRQFVVPMRRVEALWLGSMRRGGSRTS